MLEQSEMISSAIADGNLAVVGANYRLHEGRAVEDIVVGAYNGAIPAVLSPYVRGLLARIVHVEAQHAASFGPVPAPDSFDAVLGQAVVIQRIERYVRA